MFNYHRIFKITLYTLAATQIALGYAGDESKQAEAQTTPKKTLNANAPAFRPKLNAAAPEYRNMKAETTELLNHLQIFKKYQSPASQLETEGLIAHLYKWQKLIEETKYIPDQATLQNIKNNCNDLDKGIKTYIANYIANITPYTERPKHRIDRLNLLIEDFKRIQNL